MNVLKTNRNTMQEASATNGCEYLSSPVILVEYFVITGSCRSKDARMQHPVSGAL